MRGFRLDEIGLARAGWTFMPLAAALRAFLSMVSDKSCITTSAAGDNTLGALSSTTYVVPHHTTKGMPNTGAIPRLR